MKSSICKKPIIRGAMRFIIWLTAVTAAIPCAAFIVLASAWLVGVSV